MFLKLTGLYEDYMNVVSMQKAYKFKSYSDGMILLKKQDCIIDDEHFRSEIDGPGSEVSRKWPDRLYSGCLPPFRFAVLGWDGTLYFTERGGTPEKSIQHEIGNYLKNLRN